MPSEPARTLRRDGVRHDRAIMTMMDLTLRGAASDRATLDRTAEDLCRSFAISWTCLLYTSPSPRDS